MLAEMICAISIEVSESAQGQQKIVDGVGRGSEVEEDIDPQVQFFTLPC